MKKSAHGELNRDDLKAAAISALQFLSVPVIFYLTAVLGILQLPGHHFAVKDLIPSDFVINSVVTWFAMQLLGLFKRFNGGK